MKERFPAPIDEDTRKVSAPLAERMDPAIGEATSVMGTVMTELLRRTLRGGVMKIGEELDDYVHEKVGETIQDQRPVIENLAVEVADKCARIAATEVATEEVRALESRTTEADRNLDAKIEKTDKGLTTRIEETGRQSQQATQETAQRLTGQIEETEKRVQQTFQAELNRQLSEIAERGRKGKAALEARLQTMEEVTNGIGKQLAGEQEERRALLATLREQVEHEARERRSAEESLRHELEQAREEARARLREEVERLLEANHLLHLRVTELEKPRGLRALWAWFKGLFGKRKPAPADPDAEEVRDDDETAALVAPGASRRGHAEDN